MDIAQEDISRVGLRDEDAGDRDRWWWFIGCGGPWGEQPELEEKEKVTRQIHLQKTDEWGIDGSSVRIYHDPPQSSNPNLCNIQVKLWDLF